ncbi:MAG TPA: GIY-YIG nuclease family protein [Roseiflexaceae bacterium]|nr:GIY-YIG nuclease family protein [Roseiflexaceae bacterium]
MPRGIPEDVAAINREIRKFLDTKHPNGKPIGSALGVYTFFDYDEEPIYVGQTEESLRARIGRHMTNQRTDAVAMNVLDPFEVAYIEVWPLRFDKPSALDKGLFQKMLGAAEYTVFQKVLRGSKLGAVLNEKDIPATQEIELPVSYRARIIPEAIFHVRLHPDTRIARRASTIARLAQVISERDVSPGLRRTLVTQARRLESLAAKRFAEFSGSIPVEQPGEETGEEVD